MSDYDELKETAKTTLKLGLEAAKPIAKKVLSSTTGQTLVMVATDVMQEVLSSMHEKTKEKETPKRAWNEGGDKDTLNEVIKRLKKENPELLEKLSTPPHRNP